MVSSSELADRHYADPAHSYVIRERVPVRMLHKLKLIPIVEACAPHVFLVQGESRLVDDVQAGSGANAEPRNVTRIRRDFGTIQGDLKHKPNFGSTVKNPFPIWPLLREWPRTAENCGG